MINKSFTVQREYLGDERNKVIVCDDFLSDPLRLIEYATRTRFSASPMLRQRKGYPGVRGPMPIEIVEPMVNNLKRIIKTEFDVPDNFHLDRPQSSLCMMTVPEEELGPHQTIPHFDTSKNQFFAALLFLCGEEHGGTGFYKHKSTGYESISSDRSDSYLDKCFEELNGKEVKKRYFSESDNYYTKIGFFPAQLNRLLIYRGCLLHSANIKSPFSLTADAGAGRLTANIFLSFS